jgi:hypothetical protein
VLRCGVSVGASEVWCGVVSCVWVCVLVCVCACVCVLQCGMYVGGVVNSGVVWCGVMWCGVMWCGMVPFVYVCVCARVRVCCVFGVLYGVMFVVFIVWCV